MFIKNIKTLIPGLKNDKYGHLVRTSDVLSKILIDDSNSHLIEDKTGIESISCTNTTFKQIIKNLEAEREDLVRFSDSMGTSNKDIYKMLEEVIKDVSVDSEVKHHIHIQGFSNQYVEYNLAQAREKAEIKDHLNTFIIQQGCSGLLTALNMAKNLNGDILITSENNMLPTTHQLSPKSYRSEEINDWLWPVIFGEAVGAMVVSNEYGIAKITDFTSEIAQEDWRVNTIEKGSITSVRIRAREVKQTFLKTISRLSLDTSKDSDHICIHESNSKLVQRISEKLPQKPFSISKKAGTLACVSIFTSLEDALKKANKAEKIGACLIGESSGKIVAGTIKLSVL